MGFGDAVRARAAMLATGTTGGGLQRLVIKHEKRRKGRFDGEVETLFNPNEITIGLASHWDQQHPASPRTVTTWKVKQKFRTTEARMLSVELLFDTYEDGSSVYGYADAVMQLARVDSDLHRPPHCILEWGRFQFFTGVLSGVQQRYSLFLADGTPVRATLSCTFLECGRISGVRELMHTADEELYSADVDKSRQVSRTDTLQSIAAEEYDDPGLWRHIARANGIVNPRVLPVGAVLTIPKLRP